MAQRPDVIVTHAYPVDSEGTLDPEKPLYGFNDLEQQKLVGQIAPIVAIAMAGSATTVIERTAEFARSLGVTEQEASRSRSRTRKPPASGWRRHVAGSPDPCRLGAATWAPLRESQVREDQPGPAQLHRTGNVLSGPRWVRVLLAFGELGNITDYRTDVVLYSLRAMDGDAMLEQPTFAQLPAAKAKQLYPWEFSSMDYVAQARTIDRLAANLEKARKVT